MFAPLAGLQLAASSTSGRHPWSGAASYQTGMKGWRLSKLRICTEPSARIGACATRSSPQWSPRLPLWLSACKTNEPTSKQRRLLVIVSTMTYCKLRSHWQRFFPSRFYVDAVPTSYQPINTSWNNCAKNIESPWYPTGTKLGALHCGSLKMDCVELIFLGCQWTRFAVKWPLARSGT